MTRYFCTGSDGGPAVVSRDTGTETTLLERLEMVHGGNIERETTDSFGRTIPTESQVRTHMDRVRRFVHPDTVPDEVVAQKIAAEEGEIIPQAKKRNHDARPRTGKNFGQ